MHINVSLGAWEKMKWRVKLKIYTYVNLGALLSIHCSIYVVLNVNHLVKCVEDSLSVSVGRIQGFGFLDGDDWLFKLLQP